MAKIQIPGQLKQNLGPAMGMDIHWIDAKLQDGSIARNLVVRGETYITGASEHPKGEGQVNFTSEEIQNIRRPPAIWSPIWPKNEIICPPDRRFQHLEALGKYPDKEGD